MKQSLAWLWILACCALDSLEPADYKDPFVGSSGVGGIQQCEQNPALPCGWVYDCGEPVVELCIVWDDRAEIPKLRELAESLYGDCTISKHERFAGTPLCRYQCPSAKGCNAFAGCFCLEGVTP